MWFFQFDTGETQKLYLVQAVSWQGKSSSRANDVLLKDVGANDDEMVSKKNEKVAPPNIRGSLTSRAFVNTCIRAHSISQSESEVMTWSGSKQKLFRLVEKRNCEAFLRGLPQSSPKQRLRNLKVSLQSLRWILGDHVKRRGVVVTTKEKCFFSQDIVSPVVPVRFQAGSVPDTLETFLEDYFLAYKRPPGFSCNSLGREPVQKLLCATIVSLRNRAHVFLTREDVLHIRNLPWTHFSRFALQDSDRTVAISSDACWKLAAEKVCQDVGLSFTQNPSARLNSDCFIILENWRTRRPLPCYSHPFHPSPLHICTRHSEKLFLCFTRRAVVALAIPAWKESAAPTGETATPASRLGRPLTKELEQDVKLV